MSFSGDLQKETSKNIRNIFLKIVFELRNNLSEYNRQKISAVFENKRFNFSPFVAAKSKKGFHTNGNVL